MIARPGLAIYDEEMPSKNRVKEYAEASVYHIYNRGNNKQRIFLESEDYAVFLNILKRYLTSASSYDASKRIYKKYVKDISLLAYCLMPNHFHLLVYQEDARAISRLMLSVCTSYTGYFNRKYDRLGRLYQDAFKASRIAEEKYWLHISRYIHLNPSNWQEWEWSSIKYYLGQRNADWVKPRMVLESFAGQGEYMTFLQDYDASKAVFDELKHVIAD